MIKRQSGVLLPVFSLPGAFGIGTLGAGARAFIDRMAEAGFSLWQTLPLCPPDGYRSPYAGRSSFACDTALLDPYEMAAADLLSEREAAALALDERDTVDAAAVAARLPQLAAAADRADRAAVEQFLHTYPETAAYCRFVSDGEGRDFFGEAFLQYEFRREWEALRTYAHSRSVTVIGDLPMYPAPDSCDLRTHPEAFLAEGAVAGAPPDAFAAEGQIWGNPLYDYAAMRREGFSFLRQRFAFQRALFDGLRLDHFRGFSSYYAIPQGGTAAEGRWCEGPGQALFDALREELRGYPVIAEDLGVIDEATCRLRAENGFLSTRVFQFAFLGDPASPHLPENCHEDSAVYSGTHDNDTLMSFLAALPEEKRAEIFAYCDAREGEAPIHSVIRTLLASRATLAILPLADLLGLGSEARINVPGRADGNWCWRVTGEALAALDAEGYLAMNREAGR